MGQDDTRRRAGDRLNGLLIAGPVLHWLWSILFSMAIARFDSLPDRTVFLIPALAAEIGLWLVGVALVTTDWVLYLKRRSRTTRDAVRHRMSFLVVLVFACRLLFLKFPALSANLLYFGAPAVMAWALTGLLPDGKPAVVFSRRRCVEWLVILVAFTLLYAGLGVHFTKSVGEHSGDEGHYLVQAQSLYHDHDLDIRNNVGEEDVSPSRMHVSPCSRDDKWYSWHTQGLPILLAPTVPGGVKARHLVLGLIAGLGLAGVYLLCLQAGSTLKGALAVVLLLGCSTFWGIYACRALPEVLGATLATYAMSATLAQKRYPWTSAAVAALVVCCLPWAHTRFIPLTVTAIGCYGLQGLLGDETWPAKLRRLTVFTVLCILGLGAYQAFQLHHFTGGSAYPVKNLLFSLPVGLWHTLASNRGVLYTFPVFASALVATVYLLVKHPRHRYALFALLYFLSVFLTSCSTRWYTGGSCLPGRFLLVVTPVLMVALARVLPGASPGFRGLTWYLGLFSVSMFVTELTVLDQLGKAFSDPLIVDVVHPSFPTLTDVLYAPERTTRLLPAALLYGVAALLLFLPGLWRPMQAGILAASTAVVVCLSVRSAEKVSMQYGPRKVAKLLERRDPRYSSLIVHGDTREPRDLLSFSDRFAYAPELKRKLITTTVTTEDLGERSRDGAISLPHLRPNDWNDRGYRWATLVDPFRTGRGDRLLVLNAQLTGDVSAEFVIREGSRDCVTRSYAAGSVINDALTFVAEDAGDVYILVRLEGGEGTFTCKSLGYTAFSEALLQKANLTIPVSERLGTASSPRGRTRLVSRDEGTEREPRKPRPTG